jgi:hypothetical protein
MVPRQTQVRVASTLAQRLSLAFMLAYAPRQAAWLFIAVLLADFVVRGGPVAPPRPHRSGHGRDRYEFRGHPAASGSLSAAQFLPGVAHFWLGDLIGIVVTTPFLLVLI